MVIFSGLSLYFTTLVISGFKIKGGAEAFIITTILLAIIYFIINPLTKLILLPLNLITLGLVSVVAYILLFNFVLGRFELASFHSWTFPGFKYGLLSVPKIPFNYMATIAGSAILYSLIINLLMKLL
jgi:uncharacterized membrane protein YvlD (DUF360 family)